MPHYAEGAVALVTRIRPLLAQDLDAVLAIQAASPEAASWSRADYEGFCSSTATPGCAVPAASPSRSGYEGSCGVRGWVAAHEELVVGFLVARRAADELEVLNLAVAAQHRRAGIGSLLLEHALDDVRGPGASRAYLEVRASNHAAIAFYQRHGFTVAGQRARYYADPVKDALVLSRTLVP